MARTRGHAFDCDDTPRSGGEVRTGLGPIIVGNGDGCVCSRRRLEQPVGVAGTEPGRPRRPAAGPRKTPQYPVRRSPGSRRRCPRCRCRCRWCRMRRRAPMGIRCLTLIGRSDWFRRDGTVPYPRRDFMIFDRGDERAQGCLRVWRPYWGCWPSPRSGRRLRRYGTGDAGLAAGTARLWFSPRR